MQISYVMRSYTQPIIDQIYESEISQPIAIGNRVLTLIRFVIHPQFLCPKNDSHWLIDGHMILLKFKCIMIGIHFHQMYPEWDTLR